MDGFGPGDIQHTGPHGQLGSVRGEGQAAHGSVDPGDAAPGDVAELAGAGRYDPGIEPAVAAGEKGQKFSVPRDRNAWCHAVEVGDA